MGFLFYKIIHSFLSYNEPCGAAVVWYFHWGAFTQELVELARLLELSRFPTESSRSFLLQRVNEFVASLIAVLSHPISPQSLKGPEIPQRLPSHTEKGSILQEQQGCPKPHGHSQSLQQVQDSSSCSALQVKKTPVFKILPGTFYQLQSWQHSVSGGLGKGLTNQTPGLHCQILGSLNFHFLEGHTNF